LQLSRLVPLHYRHDFHSRLADLNRLLRYFLGGYRPNKTTHQILSPTVFAGQVRICTQPEWYFTDESTTAKTVASTSPTYATQIKRIPNIKL
jgi:hypothetical protein